MVRDVWTSQQVQDIRNTLKDVAGLWVSHDSCPLCSCKDFPETCTRLGPLTFGEGLLRPRVLRICRQLMVARRDSCSPILP